MPKRRITVVLNHPPRERRYLVSRRRISKGGALAITPHHDSDGNPGRSFTITHIPTGFAVLRAFPTLRVAVATMAAVDDLTDWSTVTLKNSLRRMRGRIAREVHALGKRAGAY